MRKVTWRMLITHNYSKKQILTKLAKWQVVGYTIKPLSLIFFEYWRRVTQGINFALISRENIEAYYEIEHIANIIVFYFEICSHNILLQFNAIIKICEIKASWMEEWARTLTNQITYVCFKSMAEEKTYSDMRPAHFIKLTGVSDRKMFTYQGSNLWAIRRYSYVLYLGNPRLLFGIYCWKNKKY